MSTKGAPRRYGFACLMCRRRKIRCDGKKSHCANCLKAKEFCNYKESPTYNAHLVQQVQHFKLRAERLESQVRDLASVDHEDRDRKLAGIVRELGNLRLDASLDIITRISLDTFSPFTNSANVSFSSRA